MFDLGPDELRSLTARAKRQVRQRMRALRQALPASAVHARSERIVDALAALPAFEASQRVALFWPMAAKNEVDLGRLDATARAQGKQVFYPFMDPTDDGYTTGFRLTASASDLAERGRGFAEPDPASPVAAPGELDLVVVPALAVSGDGYRIGYGIGFYDSTLSEHCPPARSVVVAFDFQLLVEAPHDENDFRCDEVVTDRP